MVGGVIGPVAGRVGSLDWDAIRHQVHERGYAVTPAVLAAGECQRFIAAFDDDSLYRSIIDMRAHRFGSGTYKYFARPLPELVDDLRRVLYEPLAAVANEWAECLGATLRYPATLEEFTERCHAHDQRRPTALIFRYHADDFNALHQDVYGDVGFPFQVLTVLSRPDEDFTGGEFLLVTQVPRAQSVGEVITLGRGQLLIFPNAKRPVQGSRGWHTANVRHGVSRVRSGTRYALGVIFHDAR
jgi:hypothetical protein